MKGRSIVGRVVAGTVLVAIVSSLALAAGAAVTARLLWRSRQREALKETFAAFVRSAGEDAAEDKVPLGDAVAAAIQESDIPGHRIEAWRGGALVAANPMPPRLGPPSSEGGAPRAAGWIVHSDSLPGGMTLIMGLPEESGSETRRLFTRSLLTAMPLSLLIAALIGVLVGRRTTRPLVDFTARVSRIEKLGRLAPTEVRGIPREVLELEEAFRHLLARLTGTLARELEFAANASHELRTPLTTIRLQAERALADAGPDGRVELARQVAEIDRMTRLIDSLLVMARDAETGIPWGEVVNLADVVRAQIARGPSERAWARSDLPDEALVRGDETLLGIAVENLLDNARKYTAPDSAVELRLHEEAGRVRLTVTSTGARLPESSRERLFERFYRDPEARAAHAGHGLGLPLARHIARLHGGDVDCLSTQDGDATFVLDLPAWTPGGLPAAGAAAERAPAAGTTGTGAPTAGSGSIGPWPAGKTRPDD